MVNPKHINPKHKGIKITGIIIHCNKCYEAQMIYEAKSKKLMYSTQFLCKKCGHKYFLVYFTP